MKHDWAKKVQVTLQAMILILFVAGLACIGLIAISQEPTRSQTDSNTTAEWYVEWCIDELTNGHITSYPLRTTHITEDHGRINTGHIFIVEYEVSLPLSLTVHLGNTSIIQTFTEDILDFLGGTYSNYDESDGCVIAVFLNNTHLRLKVNSTQVGVLRWNIKMYNLGRLHMEISGSMIFDRIVVWSSTILEPDDFDDQYAWGGTFNFTFKWNPDEDRWEAIP